MSNDGGLGAIDQAWATVRVMIDGAANFGRFTADGGQVVGWWPKGPGPEEVDANGRRVWLNHKTFDPLSTAEADSIAAGWLKGALPEVLRHFLTRCSNGLEFASGDLVILGHRRRKALDPESGFSSVMVGGRMSFRFARWGNELVWMDLDSGNVGAAPTGTRYLRTWDAFSDFLVDACREHLASFDGDGRRIGFAALPTPAPPPSDLRFVPSEFQPRAESVRKMLVRARRRITADGAAFEMFRAPELPARQVGYAIDAEGRTMSGAGAGDWKPHWLAIGYDHDLGDPLIVDLSSPALPVFLTSHGAGDWQPVMLADSLERLLRTR